MLKSENFVSYMQKPSWCFAVMTRYFTAGVLGRSAPLEGVKLDRVELSGKSVVLFTRHLGLELEPLAVIGLALPLARGHGVDAPVDEHPEFGVAEPRHARVVCGLRLFSGTDGRSQ